MGLVGRKCALPILLLRTREHLVEFGSALEARGVSAFCVGLNDRDRPCSAGKARRRRSAQNEYHRYDDQTPLHGHLHSCRPARDEASAA